MPNNNNINEKKYHQDEVIEVIKGTLPGDKAIRRRRKKRISLKRALGIPGIFSIAYGNLGNSIYITLGVTAVYALGATPLVFMIAAIFFVFTAMAYAEGTAAMPEAGGSSSFARRGINEVVSFIAGWCLILSYTALIAISSYSAISYLGNIEYFSILKESKWSIIATAILLLSLMIINIVGVRKSSILNVVLAGLDVATQSFLVLMGALFFFNLPDILSRIHWGIAPTWTQMATALFLVTISFTGIETISNMAEESISPETTIPRSMGWSVGIIIFLFLGLSFVGLNSMPVSYQVEGYIYSHPVKNVGEDYYTIFGSPKKLVYYKASNDNKGGKPVSNALIVVGKYKAFTDKKGNLKVKGISKGKVKVFTDKKGYFKIKGLNLDNYKLSVLKSGYNFEPIYFTTNVKNNSKIDGKWTTKLAQEYKSNPLYGIAGQMPYLKDFLKWWVSLLGFTILIVATNVGILGVSRVVFSMGSYKQIPPLLAQVHPKFRTPYIAIIIFTIIAFIITLWGKTENIAHLLAFAAMISYTIAHISIIALRINHPEMKRPYKIPFNLKIKGYEIPITSVIGTIAFFVLWIIVNIREEIGREFGIPFILVGVLIYIFYRNSQGLSLTKTIDKKKRR